MLKLALLLVAVAAAGSLSVGPSQDRIVGGSRVPKAEFPYLAIVYYDGVTMCAGNLIADRWLVTAGHCYNGQTDIVSVFGVTDLHDPHDFNNWQTIENCSIIVHPEFNVSTRHNDIGLIHLPYAPDIVPGLVELAALPEQGPGLGGGEMVYVAGYGKSHEGDDDYAGFLQYIQEVTISNDQCADVYPVVVVDDMALCATAGEGVSFCEGDSGSGAITKVDGAPDIVQGLVSFGHNFECGSGYPDGFSRVSNYVDWINEVIAANP